MNLRGDCFQEKKLEKMINKFIKNFFKKVFKIINFKMVGYFLIFLGIIIFTILAGINVHKTVIITIGEVIKTADYLVIEEQKRDLIRFEKKIAIAEEHINQLQEQLKNIKVGRWTRLTEKEKRNLLTTTWELRKDSLRIENALINHHNDWSVNFYPRRDEVIEDKMKEYWRTHILIDRVIDGTERIVYTSQGIDKFQLQKLQEDLKEVKKMIDQDC